MAAWKPRSAVPAGTSPAASVSEPEETPQEAWRPRSASPRGEPTTATDPIVRSKRNKHALDKVTLFGVANRNLPDAMEALTQALVSGDQQEIEKARRNFRQAQGDVRAIFGGTPAPQRVQDEAPIIGDGTGLEQLGNAFGAFFVPFRQLLRQQALGPDRKDGRSPARELAERTWEQIKYPSKRQTPGAVAREVWDEKGLPVKAVDDAPVIRSRAARVRDILSTPPSQYADPEFVARQRAMREDERKTAEFQAANPYDTKKYLGMTTPQAEVAAEVGEAALPTPGSLALGAATKYAVGVPLRAGGRAFVKAADKTQAGRRMIDAFTYGGPLRRIPGALANQPELPAWERAIDELLEMEVASKRQRFDAARRLKGAFQPLSPAERTLSIDAIEHPEILSGNPQLLEPLAQQGVDVTSWINPSNAPAMGRLWRNSPTVAKQVADKAAAAGLYNAQSPFAQIMQQIGPHAVPPDILADWVRQTGGARPDIRKLWPVRKELRDLHETTRAARVAVDPKAHARSEPYIVHSSERAAERKLQKKGIPIAALDPEVRDAAITRSQGFVHKPGLSVHPEYGRELNDKLNAGILKPFSGFEEHPILPVPDTRQPMNAAMTRVLPPGSTTNRDYFTGRVLPQAQKIERDIEDTNVLQLLEQWAARGKDVTNDTIGAMTAGPGGVGNWKVPQTSAWERVSRGRKIAVPLPVAEAAERLNALGGQGMYDTMLDVVSGRSPAAARFLGGYYSPLSELFKIPATVMNPRYYVRNFGGNYGQMYKEFGVNALPLTPGWSEDTDALNAILSGNRGHRVSGTTTGAIEDALRRRGNLGDTANPKIPIGPSIEQELADIDLANPRRTAVLRSLNPLKPSVNPVIQGAAETFGRRPEEAHRVRATLRGLARGDRLDDAVKTTEDLLFNPNATSEGMLRLSGPFPFIRWWGKNIPLQLRLAEQHPNRLYTVSQRAPELSRQLALDDREYAESERRPRGRYLSGQPLYWTGLKDVLGQQTAIPYPFSTEGELYDAAEIASSLGRDIAGGNVTLPMFRQAGLQAAMSRANPIAQFIGEPNRDILRGRDINLELRNPSGELIGYQEDTGRAGPLAEVIHRGAERFGFPPGEQLPITHTSRAKGSPYVMQDASAKRAGEMLALPNAFPLSLLRLGDQNSTLPWEMRIPAIFGAGVQAVPYQQTELNRVFQTQSQIKHQKKTTRQKSAR